MVVCDATVGNVTIKFFEGLSSFIFDQLRTEFKRWPLGPDRLRLHAPGHQSDPSSASTTRRLGGAPLLGVKGTVLITHGRARRRMIGFAVEVGAAAARARIPTGSQMPSDDEEPASGVHAAQHDARRLALGALFEADFGQNTAAQILNGVSTRRA